MRVLGLVFLIAISACAAPPSTSETAEKAQQRDHPAMLERRQQMLDRKVLQRAPKPSQAVTGEVPPALLAIVRADLSKRVTTTTVTLLRAESVVWPSGALGCGQPGMTYIQVTIPGYHVVYEVEGKTWDYRLNGNGGFMLCDKDIGLNRPLQ